MRREEKEKEGKAGESEVGGGTNERGGEGEIPSAGPRFPRSNKWRMETETGAQNMAGGGGRERPSPTLIGCGRWREREAHFCIIWQQGYGKIGWGKARAPEQRGGRAGLPRGAERPSSPRRPPSRDSTRSHNGCDMYENFRRLSRNLSEINGTARTWVGNQLSDLNRLSSGRCTVLL